MKELGKVTYPPSYTVAKLPTAGIAAGALAYASNGRAITGVGALGAGFTTEATPGTGCHVSYSGSVWRIMGTTTTVTA